MKTTFRIIAMVLVAGFYSCQKSDVSLGVSSINSDGVFSGTIVNDSNRIDSIKVYSDSLMVISAVSLGKSTVSSSGEFSLILSNPVLHKIGTGPNGVVVSDITAMVGNVFKLEANKGGIRTGTIKKSNFSIRNSMIAGGSESQFMYSDRAFTIKGTEILVDTSNDYTYNFKINYNIIFKKGWNEIVLNVDSNSDNTSSKTAVETYSNAVTSDMQWRYYPYNNASSVRVKTRGVHAISRPGFLFR